MAKGGATKFVEGAIAGLALGVAASVFLASKKGKEVRKTVEDMTVDFYKQISPKIKKIEKMGEKEYKDFMREAASKYAKTKKMTDSMSKELIKNVQQSWKHIAKHLPK